MTKEIIPPRKEALSTFLTRQYIADKLNPGNPVCRYLRHGPRIDMTYIEIENESTLRLQLHRSGTSPSLVEWRTILKYLGVDYQGTSSCFLTGSFSFDTLPKSLSCCPYRPTSPYARPSHHLLTMPYQLSPTFLLAP